MGSKEYGTGPDGEPLMRCLLKPHQNSTWMRYTDMSREAWDRLIASPLVRGDKSSAPLIIWGHMADSLEIDPAYNQPRCIANNVGTLFALQIDVDNGCRIEEFVKDYHRYSFQLYTSYSYTFKPGDRFRAIFPLKEPIETSWLVPTVKAKLMELFSVCDESCFDKAHWQILPCIRAKDAPYRYIQHQGERLSFASENFQKMAEKYEDSAHWRREIRKADYSERPHEGAIKKAQELLDNAVEGSRNRTMYSVLCWLHDKVQIDESEAYELNPPMDMDKEFASMILRIWK